MATQLYATATPRIGKLKGEILPRAIPKMVLGISGDQKKIGKNQSDTIVYRRWLPKGGSTAGTGADFAANINKWDIDPAAQLLAEGGAPAAETLTPQDITVQLQEYYLLFSYSSKTAELYEDKIPPAMKIQVGEGMGLLREMIDWGALKGITNAFYAGGTSLATVDEPLSLALLRRATKSIKGNRGSFATEVLTGDKNWATYPVERGYIVYASSDCENDIRNLPKFRETSEYANRQVLHDCEIGSVEGYRFIISPELTATPDAGGAIASTGLVSTTGANIDVYHYVVVGQDAWANLALRGMDSFGVIDVPYDRPDSGNPLGTKGFIGARMHAAAFIQNDGWCALLNCGATDI